MTPFIRCSILILTFGLSAPALGGVGQGNPRALFNMTQDYRIDLESGWTTEVEGAVTRIHGPLTYRQSGHLLIKPLTWPDPAHVCRRRTVAGTAVELLWIGEDCAHGFFGSHFESVFRTIRAFEFKH